MSINLEPAVKFFKDIQSDIKTISEERGEFAESLKGSVALRIVGVAVFAFGFYIGLPGVIAWLTNQPGAFNSVFFGAVWVISGHDLAVIGDNMSTFMLAKIGSVRGAMKTLSKVFSATGDLIEANGKAHPWFTGTWVAKYIIAVLPERQASRM